MKAFAPLLVWFTVICVTNPVHAGQPEHKTALTSVSITTKTSTDFRQKNKRSISERVVQHLIQKKLKMWQRQRAKIEGCDEIRTHDGLVISANIIEITDAEIKYKLCGQSDGAARTLAKSELKQIIYSNGDKVEFSEPTASKSEEVPELITKERSVDNRGRSLALFSLIFALTGLGILPILGSALGILLGLIALYKINNGGRKGKWMAIAGIIIGSVTLLGIAIILSNGGF